MVTDLYADGNTKDTFQFKLTIDATNYNGGGYAIDEVAIKVSSSTDKAEIVDAPGGANLWNLLPGGISAGGCSGSGSGFECADWYLKTASVALVPKSVWSWTFNVDIGSELFRFDGSTEAPSIKVRYVDKDGNKVGALVSERVPEPATLGLMAIGLSLTALRRRRAQR